MKKGKGYVTVFVTLILAILVVVAVVVLEVCERSQAETKMSTALSSAMSSQLANYDRYIFDRYNILLLDKSYYGSGEAAMEQDIEELLKTDLGDEYEVSETALSGMIGITDNNYKEFKKQISDNAKYDLTKAAADKLIDKTRGKDEPVDSETYENMENDISARQEEIEGKESDNNESESEASSEEDADSASEEVTDPRETLKTYIDAGIASVILPPDKELSSYELDFSTLPSGGTSDDTDMDIDTSFSDKSTMKQDGLKGGGWGGNLVEKGECLAYALTHFNTLTDRKFDDTCMNLEMEYLVAGKKNDGENYKKVVNEILVIRFGFNFAYIVTDAAKMGECETLAAALTAAVPAMEPVVKYLLAGCWSYIESIADVYRLLRDHRVPYIKSATTWLTDFESLAHLEELTSEEDDEETGLKYNDYLMILAALQGNKLEGRMLDLIQVNAIKNSDPAFRMKNAITAFSVDAEITFKGRSYKYHEETGF